MSHFASRLHLINLESRVVPHADLGVGGALSVGHFDIFEAHIEDGKLKLVIHDHDNKGDLSPEGTVFFATPKSQVLRPADSAFDFLGVAAGLPIFVLPQSQNAELLYLGVATEDIAPGTLASIDTADSRLAQPVGEYTRFVLKDFSGPGNFALWNTNSFGKPTVFINTADGINAPNTPADIVYSLAGTHDHYNFGFTEPGTYKITITASVTLPNGDVMNVDETYKFVVGKEAPPNGTLVDDDGNPIGLIGKIPEPLIVIGADAGGGPAVRVINPETGKTIATFFAYDPAFRGGVRVATGDLNGDGVLEIITVTGAGGGPHVKVFDQKGKELASFFGMDPDFRGGLTVATGDLNGDGMDEIILGTGVGGGPRVQVFDMKGKELKNFFAYSPDFRCGVNVAAGDTNGDGIAEIITGAGFGGGPHVTVFDPATLKSIRSFFAYDPNFRNGVHVTAGDLDGNGIIEIITGAGPNGGPHVRAFDSTGSDVLNFFAYEPTFTGGVRVGGYVQDNGKFKLVTAPGEGEAMVKEYKIDKSFNVDLKDVNEFLGFDESFLGGIFVN